MELYAFADSNNAELEWNCYLASMAENAHLKCNFFTVVFFGIAHIMIIRSNFSLCTYPHGNCSAGI